MMIVTILIINGCSMVNTVAILMMMTTNLTMGKTSVIVKVEPLSNKDITFCY